jgi:CheY-like chemotaxis protein
MPDQKPLAILADDEEILRYALKAHLERMGYAVETFTRGDEALARIKQLSTGDTPTPPALVVTDHNMHGLTGGEIAVAMRSDPKTRKIPLMVITGGGQENEIREALGQTPAKGKDVVIALKPDGVSASGFDASVNMAKTLVLINHEGPATGQGTPPR